MHKVITLVITLLLAGCGTTTLINQVQFPDPPAELMLGVEALNTLPDGPTKANDALATAAQNSIISNLNSTKLTKLQQWIKDTKANVDKANKNNKIH